MGESGAVRLRRERLEALCDEVTPRATLWLAAAGGYGKTTLVEEWAGVRQRALLRIAVPAGGLTAGDLFLELAAAARPHRHPDATPLPAFAADYHAAPAVFAATFVETLARQLRTPAVLALDDLHHLAVDDPLHPLLATLAETAVAHGLPVIAASRGEPAPDWAALRGRGGLRVVDEGELGFDPEEVAAFLATHGVPPGQADAWWQVTRGWAAGLVLLLEQYRRTGQSEPTELARRPLADWFLGEVFAPLEPEDRRLLALASIPMELEATVTAEVTGMADAPERLARLCQEHAFLHALGAGRYRLHDLFRDFLRERALAEAGGTTREWLRAWARALWAGGEWNQAAALFIEAGDEEGLVAGIREAAPTLVQTGRGENLYAWLRAVPEARRRADPELLLWEGMGLILFDTRAARALLGSAWSSLAEAGAHVPMAIAWVGIVDSIWLEWAHVSEYEPWIDEFYRFEADFRRELPPALWFTVLRGILAAIGYGRPLSPDLGRWEREAEEALTGDMPDTERVMLASQLMYLNTWQFGRRDRASRVMAIMGRRPEAVAGASPLARCLWATFTALWKLLFEGDEAGCLADAAEGRAIIRRHGIGTWDDAVPPLQAAVCFEDRAALDDWMEWFLRSDCKADRPFYTTFQAHFMAARAWLNGHVHEAAGHARQSLEAAERHGSVVIFAGFRALLAAVLAESGERHEALREAARARRMARGFPSDFLAMMVYLPLARIPLLAGRRQRALPALRRAFEAGSRQGLLFPFMVRHRELAVLCATALEHDLTPDYVRWLVARLDLAPPGTPELRAVWPWRCCITLLGRLAITVDGEPREAGGRSRARLHALLSELVLAGRAGLFREELAARLWPDSPPARALNSLDVALHRLREHLGGSTTVTVTGGRVALNSDRVHVDLWEFEDLAAAVPRVERTGLERAMALYTGPPDLVTTDDLAADLRAGEVTTAFERVAARLGRLLEAEEPEAAARHYRLSLARAPLAEPLWAGLLRSEAHCGGRVALERARRLLERQYEQELGMGPPAELIDLHQRLATGVP
ncbi:MAG: BTAD domain-containing putative transcriptional regulator [Thiohalospira sp.]